MVLLPMIYSNSLQYMYNKNNGNKQTRLTFLFLKYEKQNYTNHIKLRNQLAERKKERRKEKQRKGKNDRKKKGREKPTSKTLHLTCSSH